MLLAASGKLIVPEWPQVACKKCMRLAASCIQIVPEWPPVACKKLMGLVASYIQIVPEWPPVTCKLYPSGRQLHANSRNFIHVACNWRPLGYNLYALAASHIQTLHALAASCMQSRQLFASTLPEQLFE